MYVQLKKSKNVKRGTTRKCKYGNVPSNERVASGAHIRGMEAYQKMYDRSINENSAFWGEMARDNLSWFRDFTEVRQGGFENGDVAWFTGGKFERFIQLY